MKTAPYQRLGQRPAPRFGQRLGAVGMSVALSVLGAGALVQKCAPAPPPPPPVGEALPVTGELVALVNTYRAQAGLAPLTEIHELDLAAYYHSTDMAQRRKMTHTGWNGTNAGQRMVENGYAPRMWGENVAYGQRTSTEVMTAWMNSAGHRANILNPAFTEIGVSAVAASNGVIYWTMDLASR